MSRHSIFTASSVLALASLGLVACSSQGDGTNPGDRVVIGGTSHVIWKSAGDGFGAPAPAAAPCHFADSYDLDVSMGALAWNLCSFTGTDFNDPTAYSVVAGSRTLTASERAQAVASANAVRVSNRTTCGADLDTRSLEVDGSSGSIIYGDDFYACEKLFPLYVFTEQVESLREVLDGLARSP